MWINVTLETDAGHAETLSDALMAAGAISVSVEDALAGTDLETPQFGEPDGIRNGVVTPLWAESRVTALFDPSDDLIGRIARAANAAGITDLPEIQLAEVAEQDWVRLTQSQFDPIRVTDRLWIVPSWHVAPNPDAINLILDPGLAFGTGSHPTTFLCLQWLVENIVTGRRTTLLDYGCGSGILAIAAAKLGVEDVLGIDIDENALASAKENAVNNNVSLQLMHSKESITERFDIVVANILTNPLCVLAPLLIDRLAPNGRLVLSGVLETQAQEVIDAYAPRCALHVGANLDGWVRLEGVGTPIGPAQSC